MLEDLLWTPRVHLRNNRYALCVFIVCTSDVFYVSICAIRLLCDSYSFDDCSSRRLGRGNKRERARHNIWTKWRDAPSSSVPFHEGMEEIVSKSIHNLNRSCGSKLPLGKNTNQK